MSRRSFLEQNARSRTTEAIKQIEAVTAAEVVVTVRKSAAKYRRSSVSLAAAFAGLVAVVMLLSPRVYHYLVIVVDVALAWGFGFVLCEAVPRLKRALTRGSTVVSAVEQAARLAFDELKVGGTKDKTGVLVYVALFERRVQVLPDSGIAVEVLGPDYQLALEEMARAVERLDDEAFLRGLLHLALPLGQVLPRQPDDVNELSDEVV
jgi:putative membrane protein